MESLNGHYRLLLGLNDDWAVGDDQRLMLGCVCVCANDQAAGGNQVVERSRHCFLAVTPFSRLYAFHEVANSIEVLLQIGRKDRVVIAEWEPDKFFLC